MSGLTLAVCKVLRAEWSDERLRQDELERQRPEPPERYPLACSRDLTVGDRLWCSEVVDGRTGAGAEAEDGKRAGNGPTASALAVIALSDPTRSHRSRLLPRISGRTSG